jgi:YVTN family beta-propeller protein
MKNIFRGAALWLLLATLDAGLVTAHAQGTAFTYQGRLNNNGAPANGAYDFRFRMFDAITNGLTSGGVITLDSVGVSNGLFTVTLGFNSSIFDGTPRWLEIGVGPGGTHAYTNLEPRQAVTPTPYAIFANTASNLSGTLSSAQVTGTIPLTQLPASVVTNGASGVNITGTFSGDGSALTGLAAGHNLQQVALLKWGVSSANNTFGVGAAPLGICFDGTSIWVASFNGTVTKLNASTGAVTYGAGIESTAICFDGANIWVASYFINSVFKLNPSTGAGVGSYNVGTQPYGMCFDGANIWVANRGSTNVTKLNASTGAVIGTYTVGLLPSAVCFDGSSIWVANFGSGNVSKLNPTNGVVLGTYNVGTDPYGICFDGASIWVANYGSANVMKLNPSTGAVLGTYNVGTTPFGICFDGASIWVANLGSNNVTKLNASTGVVLGTYNVGPSPSGICFDGASVWVSNFGSTNVTKL